MKNWRTNLRGSEFKVIRLSEGPAYNTVLDQPDALVRYLRPKLSESISYRPDVENFIVIHLNTRKRPIGFEVVSNGTLDTLLVHPRDVFKSAIVSNAAAIIIAHNHPSGDWCPSETDVKVTRDLIRAGQLLKIEVMDHIILGTCCATRNKDYSSLLELGYFYS